MTAFVQRSPTTRCSRRSPRRWKPACTKPGLTFRLVIERDDKQISAIHDREYLAAKDKHSWRVLEATVKDDQGGEAMLTAAPE